MSSAPKPHKVVIIGWDGATFDLIDPWIAAGELPNLAQFREKSTSGPLRSTIPHFTYPAWTTFLTGKNPGKHGVFDFTERMPGTHRIRFCNARSVRAATIWRMLSDAGRRVACMGVPVSYPPEAINGVLICGFDAPGSGSHTDESSVHPSSLLEEIRREVGSYVTAANIMPLMNEDRHEEALDLILDTMDRKGRTARYLLQREAWDVFMVLFGESDLAGHHFWRFCDPKSPLYTRSTSERVGRALLEVYRKLDEMLGWLLAECPAEAVKLIVSDHGFGGSGDRVIYMNRWLADEGYLKFKGGSSPGVTYRGIRAAKNLGLRMLPPRVKTYIFRRRQGIANRMESYLRFGGIDWSKTRVFSEELPYLQSLWINVKGREPEGIVEPGAEYDELVAELSERLLGWVDPATGRRVVREVLHRDDIYDGPYVDHAPDLTLIVPPVDGYMYQGKSSRQGHISAAIERLDPNAPGSMKFFAAKSGSHRDDGILLAQGPMVPLCRRIEGARLMDIAPTLLYLLGEPVPADMDGVILTDAVEANYLREHHAASVSGTASRGAASDTYTLEEEAVINQRLQDLGYLE